MMSSGFEPHGEQAVADALTLIEGMPRTPPKKVFSVPVSRTVTAFAVVQPGTPTRHFVETLIVTLSTPFGAFEPPLPYWPATELACARFGSASAPASAAASAEDCRRRWER